MTISAINRLVFRFSVLCLFFLLIFHDWFLVTFGHVMLVVFFSFVDTFLCFSKLFVRGEREGCLCKWIWVMSFVVRCVFFRRNVTRVWFFYDSCSMNVYPFYFCWCDFVWFWNEYLSFLMIFLLLFDVFFLIICSFDTKR